MTTSAKRLLEQVLALPAEDQRWIADFLKQAQEAQEPVFTAEELHEFERRADELAMGAVEGIPIESVMTELRQRIRAHETGLPSSPGHRSH